MRKTLVALAVVLAMVMTLCSCTPRKGSDGKGVVFAVTDRFYYEDTDASLIGDDLYIIVDRETGIRYLYYCSGYQAAMTVLLDKDGNPDRAFEVTD